MWDPITGEQRGVPVPAKLTRGIFLHCPVVCAASDQGHVHDSCHSRPLKVVLMPACTTCPTAFVYSPETGIFRNINITSLQPALQSYLERTVRATLVGNVLYWVSSCNHILEFALDEYNLVATMAPQARGELRNGRQHVILADDGDVGFTIPFFPRF